MVELLAETTYFHNPSVIHISKNNKSFVKYKMKQSINAENT